MKRRNLLVISENGKVPSRDIMGTVLSFLFGDDERFEKFSCFGGSAFENIPHVLELLDPSSVVVVMTHGNGEWIFEIFFGFFEIIGFQKKVMKTDGTHQSLYKAARAYYQGLKKGERVFEKHLPI